MRRMHNPAHPGEILRGWIPEGMTVTQASATLQINRAELSSLLNGNGNVTAKIALRLAAWLGTTPEMWIGTQRQWDLLQAEHQPRPKITPLDRHAA
jgi:antitoxin HigA-1